MSNNTQEQVTKASGFVGWVKRHPIVTVVIALFVIVFFSSSRSQPKPQTNVPASPSAVVSPAQQTVFDVPSLVGKNVDQIRKILGNPVDKDIEPTKLQLEMMGQEVTWYNSFKKEGVDLLVTYDAKTRKVVDFFISDLGDQDKIRLLAAGNLKNGDPAYVLEFVKALKDPTTYTGVKITPKTP